MDDNKLVSIWPVDSKFANFTWIVSDVCNYKCSYCNPGNHQGNHKNHDTDQYIKVLDKLISNFKNQGYKYFKFYFSGGEPTIWPPLIDICKHIRATCENSTIAVNTNLSRSPDWWKKNYIYFDDVVASFHVEGCKQDVYLQNIDFLQYRLNYLACRILMHDSRFQEVVDFSNHLKSFLRNGVIEYAGLFEELDPHSNMHYYEDEWKREFLKNNSYLFKREVDYCFLGNMNKAYCEAHYADGEQRILNATRIISSGANNFKNWKCWINDSIFITQYGDIQMASCKMSKTIGNIHKDELELTSEPVSCALTSCGCGTDINIRKVHPEHEHEFLNKGPA